MQIRDDMRPMLEETIARARAIRAGGEDRERVREHFRVQVQVYEFFDPMAMARDDANERAEVWERAIVRHVRSCLRDALRYVRRGEHPYPHQPLYAAWCAVHEPSRYAASIFA